MVIERLIDRLKDDDDKKTIKEKIEENKPATSAGIYLKMKKRNGDLPHIKCDFNNMTIKPVETNKNRIFQRHLMKLNIIPKFSGVVILCGGIGSGKTTFLHNLLNRPEFYGISYEGIEEGKKPKPYFDHVFLMTGSDDDMYDQLISDGIIKEEHVKFSPKKEDIQMIIDTQAETIKDKGLEKSPRVLIILEDIVDDLKLMRSKALRTLFIKPRQHNFMVIIMAQYLRFIPPGLRRQAMNLFLFGGDRKSTEIICDEFCPATMKTKEFMKLIEQSQAPRDGDTHPFLHINRRAKPKERFRRNLSTIVKIP